MHSFLPIIAALTSAAAAIPAYIHNTVPAPLLARAAAADCKYPGNFTVTRFAAFFPADYQNTNKSTDIEFDVRSAVTGISTTCHRNASSAEDVPAPGLAARYRCDDPTVAFLWAFPWDVPQDGSAGNGSLALLEMVCPEAGGPVIEASGSLRVVLVCEKAGNGDGLGEGRVCRSEEGTMDGRYTSLSPRPRAPGGGRRRRWL